MVGKDATIELRELDIFFNRSWDIRHSRFAQTTDSHVGEIPPNPVVKKSTSMLESSSTDPGGVSS